MNLDIDENVMGYMVEVGYDESSIPSQSPRLLFTDIGLYYLLALRKFESYFNVYSFILSININKDDKVIIKQEMMAKYLNMNRKTVSRAINFLVNNKFIKESDEPFTYIINSFVSSFDLVNKKKSYFEKIDSKIKDAHYYVDVLDFGAKKKLIKR